MPAFKIAHDTALKSDVCARQDDSARHEIRDGRPPPRAIGALSRRDGTDCQHRHEPASRVCPEDTARYIEFDSPTLTSRTAHSASAEV
jgi:hypothetical protein